MSNLTPLILSISTVVFILVAKYGNDIILILTYIFSLFCLGYCEYIANKEEIKS